MDHFDLGSYRRPIFTHSAETQRWFDIGLNWCYGFNHEEGIKCFEKALETDPECAFVHWGIAYAAGPFYNLTWKEHGEAEANRATKLCLDHIQLARANTDQASTVERRLIEALAWRFQKPHRVPPAEFEHWDDAYAAAMRRVHADFPDDHDVMALFVEALMMRTVRRLWDLKTGKPAPNSDVLEALEVCERSIKLSDERGVAQHPAIVHLHIHLLEMSTQPERGMRSADRLGKMCPDAGHMNHMPGHIYVLCGEYEKAKLASEKAVRANDLYLAYAQEHFLLPARLLPRPASDDVFLHVPRPVPAGAVGSRQGAQPGDARRRQHSGPAEADADRRRLPRHEIACASALRPLAGDHRRTDGWRARTLYADHGHAALRQGRRACDASGLFRSRTGARALPPSSRAASRRSGASSATRPAPHWPSATTFSTAS